MTKSQKLRALVSIALLSAVAGCNREPTISAYDTQKENDRMETPVMANAAPEAAAPERDGIAGYDAPKTWKLDPAPRPMREMTFDVGEGDKASWVIVMRFPSVTYTNDPLGNINRWRGQVGLEPVKTIADQKAAKIRIGAEDGTAFDLPGKAPNRLVVAMLPRGEDIWYFKFTGNTDTINAEWENFEKFLSSIKFGKVAPKADANPGAVPDALPSGHPAVGPDKMPSGHPAVGPDNPAIPADASRWTLGEYKVPASWKVDPQKRPMRELTCTIGEGDKQLTVIVSRLDASSFTNAVLPNINRWRDQVGLPPVKEVSEQKSEKTTIDAVEGSLYDLSNGKIRQILACVMRGSDIWYFKIIGAAEGVEKESAAFQQFLATIKLAPPK
ncbi:MAG: hypothetical protein ABSH20_09820 [Tepidisphaeraceae bacterium]|jgi:hypothetical protein